MLNIKRDFGDEIFMDANGVTVRISVFKSNAGSHFQVGIEAPREWTIWRGEASTPEQIALLTRNGMAPITREERLARVLEHRAATLRRRVQSLHKQQP